MHKPFKLSTLIDVIGDISNRRKQVHQQRCAVLIFWNYFENCYILMFSNAFRSHTPVLQILLETSALSRDSFTAVPMVANAVTVPTDNDKVRDITVPKIIPVGDESVGVTTGGGSKHGSGNDTVSATKLEPGSGLFVGKKILVVDDAVSILKLMSHTLKSKAEAIVTQAKDGQQAVEECEKQDFDLILTDIQMPVLDGFGEAKCIRAIEKERGLPRKIIVGISANSQVRLSPKENNQDRPRRLHCNPRKTTLTSIGPSSPIRCIQSTLL